MLTKLGFFECSNKISAKLGPNPAVWLIVLASYIYLVFIIGSKLLYGIVDIT